MRVTKLIREYVETEVSKAYAEKTPKEKAYEYMSKSIIDFRSRLSEEIETMTNNAIAKFREENNIPLDVKITATDYSPFHLDDWNSNIRQQSDKAKRERLDQRDNKIKDILLNLELGADRAELEEMLKHIKD
jgi:hypothetical protein